MEIKQFYVKRWLKGHNVESDILTPEKALKIINQNKPFAIICGEIDKPICCIDKYSHGLTVSFLDEQFRTFKDYVFSIENNRMFLQQAGIRIYEKITPVDRSPKMLDGERLYFSPQGELLIHTTSPEGQYNVDRTTCQIIETEHYEEIPKFGEYDAFLRFERNVFLRNYTQIYNLSHPFAETQPSFKQPVHKQ